MNVVCSAVPLVHFVLRIPKQLCLVPLISGQKNAVVTELGIRSLRSLTRPLLNWCLRRRRSFCLHLGNSRLVVLLHAGRLLPLNTQLKHRWLRFSWLLVDASVLVHGASINLLWDFLRPLWRCKLNTSLCSDHFLVPLTTCSLYPSFIRRFYEKQWFILFI